MRTNSSACRSIWRCSTLPGVDAVIVADMGVIAMAKKYAPRVKLHVSTQFGVINSAAANALYDLGADTVVLARDPT